MKKAVMIIGAISCMLLVSNVWASNCSKEEVIKMIGVGFEKSQVDEICNAEAMCCCNYVKTETWTSGELNSWMSADACTNMKQGTWDLDPNPSCVEKSKCGR